MEYNLVQLFTHSFKRLVKARFDNLTSDEYTSVGPVVWAHILKAQERIQLHRRIVACEPPPMVHVSACTNNDECADDWKQLWWNGMGRFLLDGRNPQPYRDAIQRFEGMVTGRVSVECWKAMMVLVKTQLAFRHEDKFIERTTNQLPPQFSSSFATGSSLQVRTNHARQPHSGFWKSIISFHSNLKYPRIIFTARSSIVLITQGYLPQR